MDAEVHAELRRLYDRAREAVEALDARVAEVAELAERMEEATDGTRLRYPGTRPAMEARETQRQALFLRGASEELGESMAEGNGKGPEPRRTPARCARPSRTALVR